MGGARVLIGGLLVLFAATPLAAQDESSIIVFGLAGSQNSPAEYDAFRQVDYSAGYHVGGGLALRLYEHVAVRGDFALASSDGTETGVLDGQSVAFDRSYYGVSLELRYPLASGLAPYVFGGGGFVTLNRNAANYRFDFTESAAILGVGAYYDLGASPVSVFAQGTGWLYQRNTVGGRQLDTVLSAGVAYTLPL